MTTYTERLHRINELMQERFDGKLYGGKHDPNGKCCILELNSQLVGIEWTDSPEKNRTVDLRPLNDINVSESLRAEWMPQVLAAWQGSLDWPEATLRDVITRVVIATVNQIIAELPGLTSDIQKACREAKTVQQAAAAADAAYAAAYATKAAADAAYAAADAAPYAAAAADAAYATKAAADAAYAAADATKAAAYAAADAAPYAADAAAYAAAAAATADVFIIACKIWIEAGKNAEGSAR